MWYYWNKSIINGQYNFSRMFTCLFASSVFWDDGCLAFIELFATESCLIDFCFVRRCCLIKSRREYFFSFFKKKVRSHLKKIDGNALLTMPISFLYCRMCIPVILEVPRHSLYGLRYG